MTPATQQTLRPPGRAQVEPCPDCREGRDDHGNHCTECAGAGCQIWKACPRCGDIGFDYLNGHNDTGGMHCRLGCGHQWTAQDPAWLIQHLP